MELVVRVPGGDRRVAVLGLADRNLKLIREALGVRVTARDGSVRLDGPPEAVHAARDVLSRLSHDADDEKPASRQDVLELISWASARQRDGGAPAWSPADDPEAPGPEDGPAWAASIDVYAGGRPVKARTPNQQAYLDAIRDHDLVFGLGPAGTGKTYLAVAAAVHLLKTERTRKVILVRPAVEAGEKLGFLPGDMQAKVNPYLRPLLDALHDMMDYATLSRFLSSDVVEVVPLAYMRGRTLNRATIILDEAQNTTRTQMKMFLTRLGQGSKMIVTGDPSQIDLPDPSASGLIDAVRVLRRVRGRGGVGLVQLTEVDIVRHPLVQRIVEAYSRSENSGTPAPVAGGQPLARDEAAEGEGPEAHARPARVDEAPGQARPEKPAAASVDG